MTDKITKVRLHKNSISAKECFFIGGGEYTEKLKIKIETKILQKINKPSILIIPWASDDLKKLKKYRKIIFNFFKRYKLKNIYFLEKNDSVKEIKEKFTKVNLVYLPGGNTEILLKNIKEQKIITFLKNFEGTLVGISAGTYVLTSGHIKIQNKKNSFMSGLGLVNVFIKAHYNKRMDKLLRTLSQNKNIYGIADNSALIFKNKKPIGTIGRVCLFSKGKKINVADNTFKSY